MIDLEKFDDVFIYPKDSEIIRIIVGVNYSNPTDGIEFYSYRLNSICIFDKDKYSILKYSDLIFSGLIEYDKEIIIKFRDLIKYGSLEEFVSDIESINELLFSGHRLRNEILEYNEWERLVLKND